MDATMTDPLIGHLLDDRYRVDRRIARGGMATVYQATDTRLDRTVAVKVMHPSLATDEQFVARFIREARSAARLSHPNVVAVHDQGEDPETERVYLVMEHVSGHTLRELMKDRGALSPAEALSVLEPVLSALAAAHRAGIVHRDIKPENVLLSVDGQIKVADFGLARAVEASNLTSSTGVLIGTVAYLSPEQVEHGHSDSRSDVYSAGILLYEMLTGSVPYVGGSPIAIAYQHVNSEVPPPSELVESIPARVDGLVLRATSRVQEDRPADAGAFVDQVREVRAELGLAEDGLTTEQLAAVALRPRPTGTDDEAGGTAIVEDPEHVGTTALGGANATSRLSTGRSSMGPRHDGPRRDGPGRDGPGRDGPRRTTVLSRGHESPPPVEPEPDDLEEAPPPRRRRRRGLIALLIVLLLAAVAGGVGWYLGAGRYTQAPALLKLDQATATATAQRQGFAVKPADPGPKDYSETVDKGLVLRQDPQPDAKIRRGGTVTIALSRGPLRFEVPSLAGAPLEQASAMITDGHLTVGSVDPQFSETVPDGSVISASPTAGTPLKQDSVVDLVVSKGRAPISVPDVRGKTLRDAGQQLDGLGLKSLKGDEVFSDTVPVGDVVSQTLAPGATAYKGDQITLTVSKGPEFVAVPEVTSKKVEDAQKALAAVGLKANVNRVLPAGPDRVLRQSPGPGTKAKPGSTVTLYVF